MNTSQLADHLGAQIAQQGLDMIDEKAAVYGDPKLALVHQARGADLILDIAGVKRGAPMTPRVIAALAVQSIALAVLTATKPDQAIAGAIADLARLAPLAAIEEELRQQAEHESRERAVRDGLALQDREAQRRTDEEEAASAARMAGKLAPRVGRLPVVTFDQPEEKSQAAE